MQKINFAKLEALRNKMHLSQAYVANILSIDCQAYSKHQLNELIVSQEQLTLLCAIFNVTKEYLFEPIEESEYAFARSKGTLNSHDRNQIAELAHFKKMLANV